MDPTRCLWTVTAGIIPGHPEEKYTRTWSIEGSEWDAAPDPYKLLEERKREASAYANEMQEPSNVNWVTLEFLWL